MIYISYRAFLATYVDKTFTIVIALTNRVLDRQAQQLRLISIQFAKRFTSLVHPRQLKP
jgi:hypothetical protein